MKRSQEDTIARDTPLAMPDGTLRTMVELVACGDLRLVVEPVGETLRWIAELRSRPGDLLFSWRVSAKDWRALQMRMRGFLG